MRSQPSRTGIINWNTAKEAKFSEEFIGIMIIVLLHNSFFDIEVLIPKQESKKNFDGFSERFYEG